MNGELRASYESHKSSQKEKKEGQFSYKAHREQATRVYRQHMDIMVKKYEKNRRSPHSYSKKKLRKSGARQSVESQEEK